MFENWFDDCYIPYGDGEPGVYFDAIRAFIFANFKVIPIGLTKEQIKTREADEQEKLNKIIEDLQSNL